MNIISEILENIFGEPHNHNEESGQIEFNCPECDNDEGKFNLAVNYLSGVYKCWSCKDTNNMSGPLSKLIKKYGNPEHLSLFYDICPDFVPISVKKELEIVTLPEEFKSLTIPNPKSRYYNEAMKYLNGRNIGMDLIDYYNLGYAESGKYFSRIILPSYNANGEINFFSTRSFSKSVKPKYLNCEANKKEIIFNEKMINWDATIYLVEGPFDFLVTPNAIPLLGKYISDNYISSMPDKIYDTLIEKCIGDLVIVLDYDAIKDAERIYGTFTGTRLGDKTKIVYLPEGLDISDVYQKYGRKGVIKLLSSAKKLRDYSLF